MPTRAQRAVLIVAAFIGVCALFVQPTVTLDTGIRLGWHAYGVAQVELEPGPRNFQFARTDHPMLAAEFVAIAFVTTCLYVAMGGERTKD